MDLNENLKNNIQRLRKERNVTQDVLAATLEISVQAISKWETGTSMPDIMQLPRIARFFGVTIDYLFYNEGTDKFALNEELPSDDTLRIIQCWGNKILGSDIWIKDKIIDLKIPDNLSNGDLKLDLNMEIWGNANITGTIGGYVEVEGDLTCSTIRNKVECGGDINCDVISGQVECEGDIHCKNIQGDVKCEGDILYEK